MASRSLNSDRLEDWIERFANLDWSTRLEGWVVMKHPVTLRFMEIFSAADETDNTSKAAGQRLRYLLGTMKW